MSGHQAPPAAPAELTCGADLPSPHTTSGNSALATAASLAPRRLCKARAHGCEPSENSWKQAERVSLGSGKQGLLPAQSLRAPCTRAAENNSCAQYALLSRPEQKAKAWHVWRPQRTHVRRPQRAGSTHLPNKLAELRSAVIGGQHATGHLLQHLQDL